MLNNCYRYSVSFYHGIFLFFFPLLFFFFLFARCNRLYKMTQFLGNGKGTFTETFKCNLVGAHVILVNTYLLHTTDPAETSGECSLSEKKAERKYRRSTVERQNER